MSLYIGLEVPSSRGSKSPIWYSNLKWRCLREIQVRMEGLIIYIPEFSHSTYISPFDNIIPKHNNIKNTTFFLENILFI